MPFADGHLDPTLERMEYGRALKGAILMQEKPDGWVSYAQPLLDAVGLFEESGVGYALVDGIAAMYYGRSRCTEDVDFVAVTGHMELFAAHPAEMEKYHFDPTCTYKLYHQSGVQVDLWKDQHADRIVANAHAVELAGRSVQMVDLLDLIAMKLRARRLKDDCDISQIVQTNTVDEDQLRAMVTAEEFEWFSGIKKRN